MPLISFVIEMEPKMPRYNKIVRDRIPNIIQASGKKSIVRKLSPDEMMIHLREKLTEELNEYLIATKPRESLEELADMLEVIRSLAKMHNVDWVQLEDYRIQKAKTRGGFDEGMFLVEVIDE